MRIVLFFFTLLLPLTGVFAYERITNVYEVVVPLSDRSDASRNTAIKKGLEQVLIRYTGYSSITNIAEVSTELDSAQRYVIEYGVETIEAGAEDRLSKKQGDALWVRFNSELIDQLAHSLELPIWPTLRPTLSYVVVMELWDEPHIPSASEYPALYMHLAGIFNERGIAAKALSAGRLSGVSAEHLWQLDQQTAELIKSRTSTDVTLAVRLHGQEKDQRKIDFLFMETDSEMVIHQVSENLITGLDDGINRYVDEMSTGLAFLGGVKVEQDLYVQILGMRSYSEYKRVLNQIAGLEEVLSIRMENATDESIGYLIRYQSDQMLLIESISEITGIRQLPNIPRKQEVLGDQEVIGEQETEIVLGSAEMPIYFRYPNPTFIVSPQGSLPAKSSLPKKSSSKSLGVGTENVINVSEQQG